ncbi:MAG: hypothetical protein V4555_19045 [Acidobacteriota bacterium]
MRKILDTTDPLVSPNPRLLAERRTSTYSDFPTGITEFIASNGRTA